MLILHSKQTKQIGWVGKNQMIEWVTKEITDPIDFFLSLPNSQQTK